MKTDSLNDWIAHLNFRMEEARIAVKAVKREDPRWFDIGEDLIRLEEDTQCLVIMMCRRARSLTNQAKDYEHESPAYRTALQLAKSMHKKHYANEVPDWEPLDTTVGLITQIDNMTTGLERKQS